MKFINYQMPTGLGITQPYNIYEHNKTTFNGISNITLENGYTKKDIMSLQSGGGHYEPNPCETTFYIFDYPIKFGEEENNDLTEDEELSEEIDLTEDEELSEEIDLRKAELADEGDDEDENEDKDEDENDQSKIIGEITSNSSKSKMKRKLSDLIDDIVSSSEEEVEQSEEEVEQSEEEVEQSEEGGGRKGRVKINNLGPLFSNQSNNTNYDSHDTLHSILRALNVHKSKKPTRRPK